MQRIAQQLLQRSINLPRSTLARSSSFAPRLAVRNFASEEGAFIPKPVYASFKVYKTKTAVDIAPVRPQLGWNSERVEDRRYLSLKRAGGFRLTFASGEAQKTFDWENGGTITLSAVELGDVLAFANNPDAPDMKFFHDPSLRGDNAGKVIKELVVKRIGNGKPGYFWNFAVTEKENAGAMGSVGNAGQRKWSIAISEGEWQVFLSLIQTSLPSLLAFTIKPQILTSSPTEKQANAGALQQGSNWSSGSRSAKYNSGKDGLWGEQ